MVWLAVVVILVVVISLARGLRGSTIYVSPGFGIATFGPQKALTPVSKDRYERILKRFLAGDLFDSLHVALRQDGHAGIVLSHEDGRIELFTSFLPFKEPDRLLAFREGMANSGYALISEDPCNVGLGPNFEDVSLTYLCENDFGAVREMVDRALDLCDGGPCEQYFVSVWRSKDGFVRLGVKVVPPRDLLGQVP